MDKICKKKEKIDLSDIKELLNFPIILPFKNINRRLKLPVDHKENSILIEIRNFFPLLETAARYKDLSLEIKKDVISINREYIFKSLSLSKHFAGCDRVSLIAVSIGSYLEEKIGEYQKKGQTLKVMIGDAVGSECVEEAAKYLSGRIGDYIKKNGLVPTRRFSPGYGDLSLEVQKIFFTELDLTKIGLTLNESLLITPQKSITAFIGWRNPDRS